MTAAESFKAGRLADAVQAQLAEVRDNPADPDRRLFLVELLLFAGDLARAERQADLIKDHYTRPEQQLAYTEILQLVRSESARRAVFLTGARPKFFGEVPEHVELRLQALQALREGRPADAKELILKADEASLPVNFTLNGKPVANLADADDRLGPILEVIGKGEYFWLPVEQIVELTLAGPKTPRDLYWAGGKLELADATGDVYLPVLYPLTGQHASESVKLGRETAWSDGDGPTTGAGLKVFLAGDDAVSLLDFRELKSIG